MDNDIILEDGDDRTIELEIIDNQLIVINTLLEIEQEPYDTWQDDRVRVLANAMKIIMKQQKVLMKNV